MKPKTHKTIGVTGQGFDPATGGFKYVNIGTKRYLADDLIAIVLRERSLLKELRFARKIIKKMKRETNLFDEGRAIANKALPRLNQAIGDCR